MLSVIHLIVLGLLFYCANGYMIPPRFRVHHQAISSKSKLFSDFVAWKSSEYDVVDLERWWKESDPLLTIGSSGVTPTHLNSLSNLLEQHEFVKVKLASDKINASKIAQTVVNCDELAAKIILLEIRSKGILLGRRR